MLKREFKKRDVTRIRNIVKGKAGEKTADLIGYKPKTEFHDEGDIWEEDGKKWTIINGVTQNVVKARKLKNEISMPLFCPKCGEIMNNKNDKNFYKLHQTCFNCVIIKEDLLKKEGKWEDYLIKIHNDDIDNQIKEFKNFVKEQMNKKNDSFVSEAGDVERWVGKIDKEKVNIYIKEAVEYLEKLKK